ncbi:hypothetical protein M011DRAFT_458660 [Sporormia fimetaria CBS 119925]|uniref:Uncharacterized protein n=1 Tax=Sporormia fimetaria CBS 119925 TaxID=1340428 RepID=A0A6A6VCF5_9PLEO|nr:hypothetical protein M011DRAFT_458660 [Sporormia fimetaria CBS 119925]
MHFESSPSTSPSKSIPISIRSMSSTSSSSSSLYSLSSQDCPLARQGSTCAVGYPSWPTGNSLQSGYKQSAPSSYISDADLFGEDVDEDFSGPFLNEAPPPPRIPPMAQAFPILPPLYVQEKPKKQHHQQRRRSSGRKQRRSSKPMSPIAESVEVAE